MCSPNEYARVIKNTMHARFKLMPKACDTFIDLLFTKQLISSPSTSSNVHGYQTPLPGLNNKTNTLLFKLKNLYTW